jgi:hypothetical protein
MLQHFRIGTVFSLKVITLKYNINRAMKPDKGGSWKTRKEKLLRMYKSLSHKDLDFKVGEENAMLAILSTKLGKSREELLKLIIML